MTHKDETHSSQIKCNLLGFSVVFLGSAYENDNLRPKIWNENDRKNMKNLLVHKFAKNLDFRSKNPGSRQYVHIWFSKCIIRVSPTMDKYQKMLQNWVISSLICIEIKKNRPFFNIKRAIFKPRSRHF